MNEQILTGKKYRVLADESTGLWNRISFWNKAADTEMDDGTSVEKKVTDLNNDLSTLNENLTIDGDYKFKVGKDGDGNVCYYGADGSLIPFKSKFTITNVQSIPITNNTTKDVTFDLLDKIDCVFLVNSNGASTNRLVIWLYGQIVKSDTDGPNNFIINSVNGNIVNYTCPNTSWDSVLVAFTLE